MSATVDPALVQRRVAYVQAVRAHKRSLHTAGLGVCLIGVLLLAWASQNGGAGSLMSYAGVAVIAAGWAILIYVIVARQAYTRAHPFDPNA